MNTQHPADVLSKETPTSSGRQSPTCSLSDSCFQSSLPQNVVKNKTLVTLHMKRVRPPGRSTRRTPIGVFGGKSQIASWLLSLLPTHHTYIEPFAGGAALFFSKPPSPVEILNDIDQQIVDFLTILRDEALSKRLQHLLKLTPWSRIEYTRCSRIWRTTTDPVEKARCWLTLIRQSYTREGAHGDWFASKQRNQARAFANIADDLLFYSERIRHAQIECRDFEYILRHYDHPDTLFYCDPPYLPSTRRAGGYAHEMSHQDHERLLACLLQLQGQVVLSGYPSVLYDEALTGWKRLTKTHYCTISRRNITPRTECVWIKEHPNRISSPSQQLLN